MDTSNFKTPNNQSSPFNNSEQNTNPNAVHSQDKYIPKTNPYEDYKGFINYDADHTNGFDLISPINTTTPNNVVEGTPEDQKRSHGSPTGRKVSLDSHERNHIKSDDFNCCANILRVDEAGNTVRTMKIGRTQDQTIATNADVFLISCMDFRLLDDIVMAMDKLGYNNNYDQFIVAGASLGVVQETYPHWGQTCIEHMEIAVNLHKFGKVMVIDHEDCGAFKKFYPELKGNIELERKYHREHIQKLYEKFIILYPTMEFEAFLMDLNGDLKKIEVEGTKTQDKNAPSYLKDAHQRKGSDNFVDPNDKGPLNQINTSPFSKHVDSSLSDQVIIGDNFKTDAHLNNLVSHEVNFPSGNNAPSDKVDAFDFGVIESSPEYMPDDNSDHETLHDRLDNLENEIKNMYPGVNDDQLIYRAGVENDEPLNTKLDT